MKIDMQAVATANAERMMHLDNLRYAVENVPMILSHLKDAKRGLDQIQKAFSGLSRETREQHLRRYLPVLNQVAVYSEVLDGMIAGDASSLDNLVPDPDRIEWHMDPETGDGPDLPMETMVQVWYADGSIFSGNVMNIFWDTVVAYRILK